MSIHVCTFREKKLTRLAGCGIKSMWLIFKIKILNHQTMNVALYTQIVNVDIVPYTKISENRYPSRWHVPVPKICVVPHPPPPGLKPQTLRSVVKRVYTNPSLLKFCCIVCRNLLAILKRIRIERNFSTFCGIFECAKF